MNKSNKRQNLAGQIYLHYRVTAGKNFRLKQFPPDQTMGLRPKDKPVIKEELVAGIQQLAELQERLYAQDRWAVAAHSFKQLDAAGKDSTIKHVMSGINPQGCQVFSF